MTGLTTKLRPCFCPETDIRKTGARYLAFAFLKPPPQAEAVSSPKDCVTQSHASDPVPQVGVGLLTASSILFPGHNDRVSSNQHASSGFAGQIEFRLSGSLSAVSTLRSSTNMDAGDRVTERSDDVCDNANCTGSSEAGSYRYNILSARGQ